jgi:hypothetical protein
MARANCPACGDDIGIPDRLKVGQKVSCQFCAEKLIVLRLNPVELDWEDDGWEEQTVQAKVKDRRRRDTNWPEAADGDLDGGDGRRRSRSKRSRKRRDARHRRNRDDAFYDDFGFD